jgi:hypothetical protein
MAASGRGHIWDWILHIITAILTGRGECSRYHHSQLLGQSSMREETLILSKNSLHLLLPDA